MFLYNCVRLLLYISAGAVAFLMLAGQRQPACRAAAAFLIPFCMLLYWLKMRLWVRANKKKPVVCTEAALVNHRQQFSGRGRRYEKSFLTFQLIHSGQELEFEVPRGEFERIQLGAEGPLKYQGWQYLSFR